ncbi:hypothetical protein DFO73_10916 [Cytobacillus oceanisediminis]|uniref:Uncharacterized protein n=1 Tax=Cytobacillus oceanisediminis TaxID=665099 RepID=A0A2V2ZRA2_9BACI|nr:hypothetical protein DFO73_10916 [Cytobacillus oceanisediminis]
MVSLSFIIKSKLAAFCMDFKHMTIPFRTGNRFFYEIRSLAYDFFKMLTGPLVLFQLSL